MPSVGTVRCEHCNYMHVLHTVVITIIIQVDGLLLGNLSNDDGDGDGNDNAAKQ